MFNNIFNNVSRNMFNNKKWETCSTAIIFGLVYYFIFKMMPWNLILKDTMVSGGDTGAHNFTLYYLKSIFPVVKTWSMNWYAGFPFLYFYPPLMFVISVIMSYFIPINIAFKLVTLFGIFLLPAALYSCLKNCNQKYPIPQLGIIGALFFIFVEKFSIYGANLPSTLAGEFSYSFSFSLFFIFFGFLVRGLNEKRFLVLNILLLGLMVISHPLPVVIATFSAPFLLFTGKHTKEESKQRFIYLLKVFIMAFCLTAFWALPFLAFQPYTSMMHWTKTVKVEEIFPATLIVFQIFSVLGLTYSIKNKDKNIFAILGLIIVSFLIFFFLDNSSVLNARFLPPFIVGYILLGAYGLGQSIRFSFNSKMAMSICMIVLTLASIAFVNNSIEYLPDWLKWNYSGFEAKEPFKSEAVDMFSYLKTLPPGGIMWECKNKEYDTYGTPIFLENLPIWTNHPTYEGLLIESSLSGPFHFVNQAEVSIEPSSAIAGFDYPPFDFQKGVKHLQMFGAKYFLAYSPTANELANKYLKKLNQFENFGVYEIPNSNLIDVAQNGFTLNLKNKKWVHDSFDWYTKGNLEIPMIFYRNLKEKKFIEQAFANAKTNISPEVVITNQTNTKLDFNTNSLYMPHIIKVSYFPDWKVKGAYGPYLISPSFMVVFPYQENVSLEFKAGPIDWLGYILSLTSLGLLGILVFKKNTKIYEVLLKTNIKNI